MVRLSSDFRNLVSPFPPLWSICPFPFFLPHLFSQWTLLIIFYVSVFSGADGGSPAAPPQPNRTYQVVVWLHLNIQCSHMSAFAHLVPVCESWGGWWHNSPPSLPFLKSFFSRGFSPSLFVNNKNQQWGSPPFPPLLIPQECSLIYVILYLHRPNHCGIDPS